MRDVIFEIARRAAPGARVVSESPSLAAYYAERAQRPDLICLSLSDAETLQHLDARDFVIVERGRRYFSNDWIVSALRDQASPIIETKLGTVPSAKVYQVDSLSLMSQFHLNRLRVF